MICTISSTLDYSYVSPNMCVCVCVSNLKNLFYQLETETIEAQSENCNLKMCLKERVHSLTCRLG
jgi:hypothetical protein